MKFISTISLLPKYTQISVLYTLLGSLNSAAINAAARKVGTDLKNMQAAVDKTQNARSAISIDKYNEYLNELRQTQLEQEHVVEVGFEAHDNEQRTRDYLTTLLTVRKPLLSVFHSVAATMPQRDGQAPADFSFEESLARQMAQEFVAQAVADDSVDAALIATGAVTAEELSEADKKRADDDRAFKQEFKFLIIDTLRDADPDFTDVDTGEVVSMTTEEEGNAAFLELSEDYQHRLINRILPKLITAKEQNIGRRRFDPDAVTNVTLIGLAINSFKKHVGASEADDKLAKMQALLAA